MADYFNYQRISAWLLFSLTIGCISLLYGQQLTIEIFIRCFLIFVIFKCLETYTVRDIRVLVICNFFLMFAALILIQELWIILYLLIAILANLSIMLKLSATDVSLRQIGSKSGKQLLIAIPLSILLFFIFPRVVPHWNVPALTKGSIGFSDTMSPGTISELFNDDSVVMQITFKKTPIMEGYWRGIILSFYTGESWNSTWYNYFNFIHLSDLSGADTADYEVILEPKQKKWLFYEGYPVAGEPNLIFSPNHWLVRQNKEPIVQRFIYSLKVQAAPYHVLNRNEYEEATQLPANINPRLNAWAQEQFVKTHHDIKSFIAFLRNYINQENFWYTLTPPPINTSKNQMDTFWFDTQKGFCEHYASAVSYILRAVGIPARVVLGYYGGQWNPISNAITLQQNDAHAWLEYWQAGIGWQQLDPTSFVAPARIDKTILSRENLLQQEDSLNISTLAFGRKFQFFLESVQFFSERWFLYYNPNSQQNLLQNAGLGELNTGELLQASVGCMTVFFILLGIWSQWWQKRTLDPLLAEYHLLQNEFRRFNISIEPSATLKQQCKSLINNAPALAPVLADFFNRYEQLRLRQSAKDAKENIKATIALFKTLRYRLRSHYPHKK